MNIGAKAQVAGKILTAVILLGVGIFLGRNFPGKVSVPNPSRNNSLSAIRQSNGKFTNPLLECDQSQSEFVELKPFKDNLGNVIAAMEKDRDISAVSVYFRDMNNGPWVEVNSAATFSPASLLKVPLAIAYYKLDEETPGFIQKTVTYSGPDANWPQIRQTIPPKQSLTVGQSYTLEELVRRMLLYSDNEAYYLLFSNIKLSDFQAVYDDFSLSLNGPDLSDDSDVTVRGYSGFFRILFNASYLNQEDSEKVLSFLAGSDFTDGLVGGVPAGVPVAHKFGEREIEGRQLDQIHDCGIVYYPQHPYLLCVMTQGSNIAKQSNAIKELSSVVYQQVDGRVLEK